jgi:hypothetical protein
MRNGGDSEICAISALFCKAFLYTRLRHSPIRVILEGGAPAFWSENVRSF